MLAQVRAGVLGSSGVGALHVDALRRIGVTVAGVAAATPEIARRDADRLGVASAYASAEDLFARDDIDVVHVCTPNWLHVPHCRAALKAGKHVVAEKPLATSAADARELLELAATTGRIHALCHNYRYYPMVRALRAIVARGDLGKVHMVHGAWLLDEVLGLDAAHWMLNPRQMGPSLTLADVGVHWWDLVEHVLGMRIDEVVCETQAARASAGTGEDSAAFLMRLAGGAIGTAAICQAAAGHGNTVTLEVVGDRATAAWDIRAANVLLVRDIGGGQRVLERGTEPVRALAVDARLPPGQPEGHGDALRDMLVDVYEGIRAGEPARDHPTFADGVRGLLVLEALLESARRRRWVAVERAERRWDG